MYYAPRLRALLIQKDTKLSPSGQLQIASFESFANSERYKTVVDELYTEDLFESFANSERYKTVT